MSGRQRTNTPRGYASPNIVALKTKAATGQRQAAVRDGTPAAIVGKTAANHRIRTWRDANESESSIPPLCHAAGPSQKGRSACLTHWRH